MQLLKLFQRKKSWELTIFQNFSPGKKAQSLLELNQWHFSKKFCRWNKLCKSRKAKHRHNAILFSREAPLISSLSNSLKIISDYRDSPNKKRTKSFQKWTIPHHKWEKIRVGKTSLEIEKRQYRKTFVSNLKMEAEKKIISDILRYFIASGKNFSKLRT